MSCRHFLKVAFQPHTRGVGQNKQHTVFSVYALGSSLWWSPVCKRCSAVGLWKFYGIFKIKSSSFGNGMGTFHDFSLLVVVDGFDWTDIHIIISSGLCSIKGAEVPPLLLFQSLNIS